MTRRLPRPTLKFTPTAWGKLVYLRDRGPTEIGGFGISDPEEPLLITDVVLVPQQCTSVTVKFDDAGVADYFDAQVDLGRRPEQFARLWLHTHPAESVRPEFDRRSDVRARLRFGRLGRDGAPDVAEAPGNTGDSAHLVDNVVRPWPFGRPPYLGVTLMKCVIHRQDSYPDNAGHWQCSVALAVLLGRVSA